MTMNSVSNLSLASMVGFYYFSFFKACFFAGLFRRSLNSTLSGS